MAELRAEADSMAKAVLALYEPGSGVWCSLHREGARVQMRHCYDFATGGTTMDRDLPPAMKREMVDFVEQSEQLWPKKGNDL